VARRTNYGFQKKQRELRKQKKKQEKAERRSDDEASGSAPSSGDGAEGNPLDVDPPERG